MNFLQPWMILALPLAVLPIIIHLINQRRYQSTPWAAMQFLLAASRMNRGYAKIRQWLILALRALAIVALVFAIGRPLLNSSMGGALLGTLFGTRSTNAIILLDRSPSMQKSVGDGVTWLDRSLQQVSATLQTTGVSKIALIESNHAGAIEVDDAKLLLTQAEIGPSDKTADLPGMVEEAVRYIEDNQLAQVDLWVCSDGNRSDWNPTDGRWKTMQQTLAEMGHRVRVRYLHPPKEATGNNRFITVDEVKVDRGKDESGISLSFTVTEQQFGDKEVPSEAMTVPVAINLLGTRSSMEVTLQGGVAQIVDYHLPIAGKVTQGYGSISIPADGNDSDNIDYFAFGQPPAKATVIISTDEDAARVMELAAGVSANPFVENTVEQITPQQIGAIRWDETSLVLWHAPLPSGDLESDSDAAALDAFVQRGGTVIFFPTATIAEQDVADSLYGCVWTQWSVPPEPDVASWRGDSDLLAATLSGSSLPIGQLKIYRNVPVNGDATTLARLSDDAPLLSRVATPSGGVYFCGTTTRSEDSTLAANGIVLYVMLQRALADGAKSLGSTNAAVAGQVDRQRAEAWVTKLSADERLSTEKSFDAGVYQYGDEESPRLVAVSRSAAETKTEALDDDELRALFAGVPFESYQSESANTSSLVEEVWHIFWIGMLLAMFGEALLCLPRVEAKTQRMAFSGSSATSTEKAA